MKALIWGITAAFALLQSFLVAAQTPIGTGGTNIPHQSPPPFPIPANSSTIVIDSKTSLVFIGTGTIISTETSVTHASVPSDTNGQQLETSTGVLLSSSPSLTPTATLSSTISSVVTTHSVQLSAPGSSTLPQSRTKSITNGQSSTGSVVRPPEITKISSVSDGIILPPGITFPPNPSRNLLSTGTEIQSSASDFSIIIIGVYPLIQSWIDHPDAPGITTVTHELNKILAKATDFLDKLPKPTDGVESCKSGKRRRSEPERVADHIQDKRSFLGNLFKTAFSLVTCIIDTTNKVKDGVLKETTDAVVSVKNLQEELKPMVDALNEVDPNNDPKPSGSASDKSTSAQPESSLSSSCTLRTVSNCKIGCTAIATTTLGGSSKRAEGDVCTTVCGAPITKCGATGATSVSTMTSTETTYQICSPDCASCNANSGKLSTDAPDLGAYSTASNGVLYLPAPTVTVLDDYNPATEPKKLIPKETATTSIDFLKRALTSPKDPPFHGDVDTWLRIQILTSPNDLAHGQIPITTTGFTFPLNNVPDTWRLVGLYGCTSVIVISRKRMFMTHIWEGPTMKTPQNLQPQVLDSLRNGDAGVPQGLTAFTGAGGDFEDTLANKVRAFIITPYRRISINPNNEDLEYPYEVGKIKDLLKDVLGRSDTITIPYSARHDDPLFDFAFGKVLIQYDPNAAWLGNADGLCSTQLAGIELWFENYPTYRYRDRWNPFSNQLNLANPLPRRSMLGDGKVTRLLRGMEVTDANEEEWREHEILMQRQGGGTCPLLSKSISEASTSPPSSTVHDRTTFRTSFVSSSSVGRTTSSDRPPSSTKKSPTKTKEEHSSTKEPPSKTLTPVPAPTSAPSKAVSVILKSLNEKGEQYNSWIFFETSVGSQADGCKVPVLNDPATRWSDRDAISIPPWPHGTFTMPLFGEDNCQYLSDGTNAGILHCPTMGEGNNIGCKEDKEKSQDSAITQCLYSSQQAVSYHRVVYCEY